MIVSHRCRFVYFGPPKTASTALHRWLSQPAFCEKRWSPEKQDQHSILIPPGAEGYFVFAGVRNPFDRAIALWAHSQSETSLLADDCYPMGFEEFVLEYQPQAHWFYRLSQSELLAPVRLDGAVRFQHLEEDLYRIPTIAAAVRTRQALEPLGWLNKTSHRPWQERNTSAVCSVFWW